MLATDNKTVSDPERPRTQRFSRWVWLFPVVATVTIAAALHVGFTRQLPFLHRESVWSIAIYEGSSPFNLAPVSPNNKPALSAEDVNDVDALFVADPFMVQNAGKWFMFMEVLNKKTGHGDIGLANSDDGLHWKYDRIVLDESIHLSYPGVFQVDGKWYMTPQADDGIHIYEATSFPHQWRKLRTVLSGPDFADPTFFRHDESWWMFVGKSGTHDVLQLFYAPNLQGEWTEHPASPIVENNADIARPGGPVIEYDGSFVRLGQDCAPKYGSQLRGFRITKLSTTEYAEEPLTSEIVLAHGSHVWNHDGMHHSDAHQLADDRWIAAVDGHRKRWIWQATP